VSTITGLDYWTGLLDWTTGLDYWTGLLDWTTVLLDWTTVLLDWTTGLDYWTGLLDWTTVLLDWTGLDYWTTGLDYWTHPNCKIQLVQYRTEAKLSYFLSYFPITALYSVFPGVSRG